MVLENVGLEYCSKALGRKKNYRTSSDAAFLEKSKYITLCYGLKRTDVRGHFVHGKPPSWIPSASTYKFSYKDFHIRTKYVLASKN